MKACEFVSYLTVEAVWAVELSNGSSAQVIVANQTQAVCIALQHRALYHQNLSSTTVYIHTYTDIHVVL